MPLFQQTLKLLLPEQLPHSLVMSWIKSDVNIIFKLIKLKLSNQISKKYNYNPEYCWDFDNQNNLWKTPCILLGTQKFSKNIPLHYLQFLYYFLSSSNKVLDFSWWINKHLVV